MPAARRRQAGCIGHVRMPVAPKRLLGAIRGGLGVGTQMFTFRTSITFAVMAFVVALTVLLIAIQLRSLRFATHEAASAYMDATSTKVLGRLRGELSAISSLVNVLATAVLHPPKTAPHPMLYLGFLLAALGAGMVLYYRPQA